MEDRMIVHVAVARSFDPLDLELDVFGDVHDAVAWCNAAETAGTEGENLFIFSCEVRESA
jgi:hypothetical protein